MKKIKWLVQTNLIQENSVSSIQSACQAVGADFYGYSIVPFSELQLPSYEGILVPYGSTTLIKNFLSQSSRQGLFFDPEMFRTSLWVTKLGVRMLNSESFTDSLREIGSAPWDLFFMKPDNDLKDFTGAVFTKEEAIKFMNQVKDGGFMFGTDIQVVISPPKNTGWEYRLFMLGSEVITSSSYKLKSMVRTDKRVPLAVHEFATETAKIWRPDELYVMDVCETDDDYKVVEFNCLNASGFYACDVQKIVLAVTEYLRKS